MDFVLERVYSVQQRIVLECGKSYTCGRAKENTIVCLGLQVSRKHCVFFHATDKLFVTDLKSSNGIFINGVPQIPYQMIQLQQNDIVGIGCADLNPNDDTLFAYKVYIARTSDPAELANTSDMSSTVPICDTMVHQKQTNFDVHNVSKDKRGISPNNCDIAVPCKIAKYEDNEEVNSVILPGPSTSKTNIAQSNGNNINDVEVASTGIHIKEDKTHMKEENDIEIVHTTFPEWDIENHILKYETFFDNIKNNFQIDNKMDISIDEDNKDIIDNNNKTANDEHATKEETKSSDKIDDTSNTRGAKFVGNVKLEDELQLTDEDEEAHLAVTDNKTTSKTPIKLKKIKHEPKTQFSEIDIVDLSDNEDGIFPYSQLFDIKFEGNVKQEVEIKQECVSNDIEKIDPIDIDDEVIILTDSDNDDDDDADNADNPWLYLLSRSQLMNEDKKPDVVKSVVKDEIDLGIWQENDIRKITWDKMPSTSKDFKNEMPSTSKDFKNEMPSTSKDFNSEMPSTSKDFNNVTGEQSTGVDASESSASKETSLERTSIDKKTECNDSSDTNLSAAKADAMDIDDAGPSNEPSVENTDRVTKQKTDAKQIAEPHNKQTEASPPPANAKYRSRFATTRKAITLIEAPHLPAKKGRGKSSDRKKDSSKDKKTSKASEEKSSSLSTSTTEENKMQKLKDKLEDHFYKDQSKGTSKGSPDQATSSKQNRTLISKEDKQTIMEERKAKLKTIAEEEKLAADNNKNVKRGTARPRVKITQKNRGDFLCNEQANIPKPSSSKSAERAKSSNDKTNRVTSADEVNVPESVIRDTEMRKSRKGNVSKNTINNVATSLEQSLSINNILDGIKLPENSNSAKDSNVDNNVDKKRDNNTKRHNSTESATNSSGSIASTSTAKSASVSIEANSVSPKLDRTKKKKGVTFSANVDIKEFAVELDNEVKKLDKKDAPDKVPEDKAIKVRRPQLEEFLLRIFMWHPVWLEEQRYLRTEPPIVKEEELQPIKLRYKSYADYYDVMLPLLLVETWHSISKDFETVANNAKHKTAMCSVVINSITRTSIPMTDNYLTTLMLEVLVSKEDLDKQFHPTLGDLISFEYVQYTTNGHKGNTQRQTFCKVFAYITSMNPMVITDFTHYNRDLRNYVPNAHSVITYTIQTRTIEQNILLNRIHRIRTITYLRADMRMIQALQYLSQSPLLDIILNPKIEDYQLSPFDKSFNYTSLVTKEKLNLKQLEAVSRVTEAVINKETKLCFIQGPPGTGKSKVIVNMVTQILYSKCENKNNKIKILLCAPSNAAIDELVTRLYDIRLLLKQKYNRSFNLVRIGPLEKMHPMVKQSSPSELAKRHLRKFMENVLCYTSNSTTNFATEKTKLQSQMDEYQTELLNAASMSEARRRTIKRRLTDASTRYELLMKKQLFDEVNPRDRSRFQRSAEDIILAGADIIACTLSSCYTNQMESIFGANKERLSVCIVDEATQSCEAETLIPLMLGVKTMVLVGDPNQLPATILSQRAKRLRLDQSVFSRIQRIFMPTQHAAEANNPIIMLDTQYRMTYCISYWPNNYFYNGRLKNATENRLTFPFHPYRVLGHTSGQNNDKFSNTTEAEFVANMIHAMFIYAKWEDTNEPISLGVLTPYNNQRNVILSKINEKVSNLPDNIRRKITYEVNTVDSFQGQERDIIIMSCVRSDGIGFLSDRHRLCVALTRAKHSLILCVNSPTFMRDQMWNSLLADARSRGVLFNVNANATSAVIKQFVVK